MADEQKITNEIVSETAKDIGMSGLTDYEKLKTKVDVLEEQNKFILTLYEETKNENLKYLSLIRELYDKLTELMGCDSEETEYPDEMSEYEDEEETKINTND